MALGLDTTIYPTRVGETDDAGIVIKLSHIIIAVLILVGARITDWVLNHFFVHNYYSKRDQTNPNPNANNLDSESTATKIVKAIVFVLAAMLIMKRFSSIDLELFTYQMEDKTISFRITKILVAVLILLFARLAVWVLTQVLFYGIYKRRGIDKGGQFAVNQLIKYIIYIIAILTALHSLGINMTLIWGGAAALLVGLGLGLQQTFNDFFSGIVLLFERTVSVGDMLSIDGEVGTVQKIGLRASIIETRGAESIIVPNSKLVNDSIVNWTHFTNKVRFSVAVGVAYGTDTQVVKKLLLKVANNHPLILEYPAPFVRFEDFGDSSLNFSMYFFTRNYTIVEDIRSDIRFEIDREFREHAISIPFPQRDLWIKRSGEADSDLLQAPD
jgi:small-conductance mechanosensitive channel